MCLSESDNDRVARIDFQHLRREICLLVARVGLILSGQKEQVEEDDYSYNIADKSKVLRFVLLKR